MIATPLLPRTAADIPKIALLFTFSHLLSIMSRRAFRDECISYVDLAVILGEANVMGGWNLRLLGRGVGIWCGKAFGTGVLEQTAWICSDPCFVSST